MKYLGFDYSLVVKAKRQITLEERVFNQGTVFEWDKPVDGMVRLQRDNGKIIFLMHEKDFKEAFTQ